MDNFVATFLVIMVLYIIYYFIRIIHFELLKYYVASIALITIYSLIKNMLSYNIEGIILVLLDQAYLVLLCLSILKKDIERKKIFDVIKNSQIPAVLLSGITNIDREKIKVAEVKIKDFIYI